MLSWLLLASVASAASPKFVVILDPGHGGTDTGAITTYQGRKIYEKDLTLALARKTAQVLKARGIQAVLTRDDDRFVPLDKRTTFANTVGATTPSTVFVSIHANSSDDPSNTGAEIYVFNAASNEASRRLADIENGKSPHDPGRRGALLTQSHSPLALILTDLATTANYAESVSLACAVERAVTATPTAQGSIRDRGVRQALFYVLMDTRMPAVLFEPGFVSNPRELSRLLSPAYQQTLARSLASGVQRFHAVASRSDQALSGVSKHKHPKIPCPIVRH